jgi:hypothetical protein
MANKTPRKSAKVAKKAAKRVAAKPALLAGGGRARLGQGLTTVNFGS